MKQLKVLWPLLLISTLLYGHFTKFPYTFILISIFILAFKHIGTDSLKDLGFRTFGRKEALVTLTAFLLIESVMDLVVQPLLSKITGEPTDYSAFAFLKGNRGAYVKWLLLMWISAAFGEELLFRAFIIERLFKLGIKNRFTQVLISAAVFSAPHLYQGTTGLLVTLMFGICYAWIFIRYQTIWMNVILHGLTDSLFLTLSYYGLLSFYNYQ